MVALTGYLLGLPAHGDGDAHLAPNAPAAWVYPGPISALVGYVSGAATMYARVSGLAHPRVISGIKLHSYFDDFYYRVHVTPLAIALGNLVTSQSRSVAVWNAHPDQSLNLTNVLASNANGMTLTSPGALPLVFAPLQQWTWQLAATPIGPSVINASLQWQFVTPSDDVTVTVSGNRITAWTLPPDWANNLTETLAWLTDVQSSVNGSQVRQQIRNAPRRQWEFGVAAQGQDRRIMEMTLYDWSARIWLLPVWVDVTFLAVAIPAGSVSIAIDTTQLDFANGGLAMLWASTTSYELVQIDTVTAGALALALPTVNTWPVGARIYPCRTATLTDYPKLPRSSSSLVQTQVRFQAAEPCDWPAIAPATTYLGLPVLESRTDEPKDLGANYARIVTTTDNDIGIPQIDDPSGQPWMTQEHCWRLNGRVDRGEHRSLLYWLAGQANALWLPSWTDDVVLVVIAASNATALTVEWAGITRFGALQAGRRHLRIELVNGSVFYRTVTATSELSTTQEQLGIDSALGVQVAPGDVRQINWMMLATLASDTMEVVHEADSLGVATSAATFVGVPMEEP